ncbi:MAG: divalent metal cation (Fe/Co/Zn/Cd) transporter, partial [Kiritimatiellia bacterium]
TSGDPQPVPASQTLLQNDKTAVTSCSTSADRIAVDRIAVDPAAVAPDRRALHRLATLLAWGTIAYNIVEGVAAIGFGVSEESVALLGFGLDSWVEVSSGVVVLWRLRADAGLGRTLEVARERVATRIIGGLLVGLAAAAVGGALVQLARGVQPGSALPALTISAISLLGMGVLWWTKRSVARKLDSKTLAADAACSRSCLELSVVLFAGSLLTMALPGLWWLDAVVAMALAAWIAREGVQTVRSSYREDFTGGCGCP